MSTIRVLLADDHRLMRAGLRALLKSLALVQVVAEAGNGHEAIQLAEQHQPDIVIMDIGMPGLNGLEATARIVKLAPAPRVIILSMHANEEYVRRSLQAGAAGYLLKGAEPAELELAIQAVMRGETYLTPAVSKHVVQNYLHGGGVKADSLQDLTPRQREILQLVAEGHSSKEIANKLNLSIKTVETHRGELMNRLNIHDIAGLVRYAIRTGLVTPES
ncbi:MAG: Two-component transcriptional response regulator, NarL/FixJ family [Nitrospira sp.]|jgi:DNA-binding NarL/FixJ family response regulator|nr:MAG: Two-component transcriptional response regulator, NarL/FixJ family [Nitrospira sp.]